jgi:hypothetical protein
VKMGEPTAYMWKAQIGEINISHLIIKYDIINLTQ